MCTPVSSTNNIDCHDILLKVALNMIKANQTTNLMGNNLVGDTAIGSLKAKVTNLFITPHLLFLGQ
jgi:hypothetical protein